MMRITYSTCFLMLLFSGIFFSCKPDNNGEVEEPTPSAPSTYNFDNVNYSGQIAKMELLKNLSDKMTLAKTTAYSTGELRQYFDNAFTYVGASKSLAQDFLLSTANTGIRTIWIDSIHKWLDTIEVRSGNSNALVRADGVDLSQAVAKTIMGGLFYDQAINKYLVTLPTADNITVTAGKGTAMEHQFDEVFGYFGAARDLNSYTDAEIISGVHHDSDEDGTLDTTSEKNYKYYARAAAIRDDSLKNVSGEESNYTKVMFDAFLKGRFSISNRNYIERDAAIHIIKENWEEIIAASAIHYMNSTKKDILNAANTSTHWSEMKFYFNMLRFNPTNKLSNMGVFETVDELIGNKPSDTNVIKLNQAAGIMAGFYGFSLNQKNALRLK